MKRHATKPVDGIARPNTWTSALIPPPVRTAGGTTGTLTDARATSGSTPRTASRRGRCVSVSRPPDRSLDVQRQEFMLGWRQAEPGAVVDEPLAIEQEDDDVFPVEQIVEHVM